MSENTFNASESAAEWAATLERIEMERRGITLRLARLDEIEAGVRRAIDTQAKRGPEQSMSPNDDKR